MSISQDTPKIIESDKALPLPIQEDNMEGTPKILVSHEAEFIRVGNDLMIKNPDESEMIKDYFVNSVPIKTVEGLILSVDDISATLNSPTPSEPVLVATNDTTDLITSAPPQKIGIVSATAEGPITAQDKDGAIRVLHEGDPVYLHDLIVTSEHSYVKITLMDDTLFQLGPQSRASLDKYAFDPAVDLTGQFESFVFSGNFRYISGKISGNNQGQHTLIKTPSANIGIRGSEIDAIIGEDGSTTVLHLSGLVSISSRYHGEEILVYERGTSIYIPNENVSYTVNQLTEEQIQHRNQEWQIFGSVVEDERFINEEKITSQTKSTDSESQEDEDSLPQANGPRNPFSPNQVDPNSDESVDDIISENRNDKARLLETPTRLSETIDRATAMEDSESHYDETLSSDGLNDFNRSDTVNTQRPAQGPEDVINRFEEPSSSELPPIVDLLPSKPVDVPSDEPRQPVVLEPIEPELVDPEPVEPEPIEPEPVEPEPVEPEPIEPEPIEPEPVEPEPIEPEPVVPPVSSDNTPQQPSIVELTLNEDNSQLIQVLSAETGTNIQLLTQPGLGTVVDNGNGTLTYTPKPHLNGEDTLTYLLNNSETIIVKLTIVPVNDAPIAVDDSFSINNNAGITISAASLIANDQDIEFDPLSIVEVRAPIGGTVSLNEGNMVFIPNRGFSSGGFEYVVSDGSKTDIGQVELTRSFQPLIANHDGPFNIGNNNSLVIEKATLLENDQFSDGELPQFRIIQSINGQATIEADGNILFTRTQDFKGQAEFEYQIIDNQGNIANATVTIIGEVNQPPQAQNDGPFNMGNNDSMTLVVNQLLSNDFDLNGDQLTIIRVKNSVNGQAILDANGNILFTRGPNFDGHGEFEYEVSDGKGGVDTARVSVIGEVISPLVPLVAQDDGPFDMGKNETLTLSASQLLENDEGESLTIANVFNSFNGEVQLDDHGNIVFTRSDSFNGQGEFDYEVSDGNGNINVAHVTIIGNMPEPVGESPHPLPDNVIITESGQIQIDPLLLSNDTDPDHDPLQIINVNTESTESFFFNPETGEIFFTPPTDFFEAGKEGITLSYEISDVQGNTAETTATLIPFMAHDDEVVTSDTTAISISVAELMENDAYSQSAQIELSFRYGDMVLTETDNFVIIPSHNFINTGINQFTYQLTDSENNVVTATVDIGLIKAEDDVVAANEPIFIESLLANDKIPSWINPMVEINGQTLSLEQNVIPTTILNGANEFDYQISDSEGHVSTAHVVIQTDDPIPIKDKFSTFVDTPLTILATELFANDIDPDGNTSDLFIAGLGGTTNGSERILLEDGNILFQPASGIQGDSFAYTIQDSDSKPSSPAIITIKVSGLINPDNFVAHKNSAFTFQETDLWLNDQDVQGQTVIQTDSVAVDKADVDTRADSTVVGMVEYANGQFTFTPIDNYEGEAYFQYTLQDALGRTTQAGVTINVENTPPVAEPDTAIVVQNSGQQMISVLENDSDADPGDQEMLIIQPIEQQPDNGNVDIVNNQILFTPNTDFVGTITFDYTIADRSDAERTATVEVIVETVAPVITLLNGNTPLNYNVQNQAQLIDNSARVTDEDSRNFEGGMLEVAIMQNRSRYDVLEIQNQGPITISSNTSGMISYNGTSIGNFTTHFTTGALLISLNQAATPETTSALLEAISYKNTAETPSTGTRTIEFTLTDGDGGTSNIASRDIEIIPLEPPTLEIEAKDDQVEIPFNQPVNLPISQLIENDNPANPEDILHLSIPGPLEPGIEARIVGNEVQLFVDALVNLDEAKFDYTVTDDEDREDTATVTLTAKNVKEGTPDNDSFTGTEGIDIFMGQEGNDTFQPSVGPDILSGGENDDLFLFDPSTANGVHILGDSGLDTLSLNGVNNQRLDLLQNRNLPSEQQFNLQDLEHIDLGVGGSNELRLSLQDVLDTTDSNNNLIIDGDESNRVVSTGQGWLNDGMDSSGLYHRYTSGDAELLVSADITNQFIS